MARRPPRSTLRGIMSRGAQPRSFRTPASRPGADWRVAVDGRAPRLGARTYIGHDTKGRGAWLDRDPMTTPRWWTGSAILAALGWLGMTAGFGYLSWRRHGGREALFGADEGR